MGRGPDSETHHAALGLLDIAQKATASKKERHLERTSAKRATVNSREETPATSQRLAVATVTSSGRGRTITSGNYQNTVRQSSESTDIESKLPYAEKKSDFRQPESRRPEQHEIVTVIVQKPAKSGRSSQPQGEGAAEPSSTDIPVPASAFAPPIIGSGDSCRSSADYSALATTAAAVKDNSDSDTETENSGKKIEKHGKGEARHQNKKRKIARTFSINTVLQRVSSREEPLADIVGLAPQTVQEMLPALKLKAKPDADDTMEIVEKLWGPGAAQTTGPSLPNRKSSNQSAADVKRHAARPESTPGAESSVLPPPNGRMSRQLSAERALHLPPKQSPAAFSGAKGKPVETGATPNTSSPLPVAATKDPLEPEPEPETSMWTGRVKHRLKTAEGSSEVELFSLNMLVPRKLVEQMPPTLFISSLAGRSDVKLGKHFVTQCRLHDLHERQQQKVATLAAMKLVAICELQRCTLTIVPFTDSHQELRVVGFMIADE